MEARSITVPHTLWPSPARQLTVREPQSPGVSQAEIARRESIGRRLLTLADVVATVLAAFVPVVLGRAAARRVSAAQIPVERCLLIGPAFSAIELGETLRRDDVRATITSNFEIDELEGLSIDEVRSLVHELGVHRMIFVGDSTETQTARDLVRAAKIVGVRVSLMPRMLEVVGSAVTFDTVGGALMLGVRSSQMSPSARMVKRCFDVAVSCVLLCLALPVFAAIALAVKLDSDGPVLYRQPRVGRRNRIFEIFKFRTMDVDAHARRAELAALNEAQGLFKIEKDPRVTRVGRALRRLSLDELPQLLNVLRGEMSLVGPRPLVSDEDALIVGFDRRRLDLTPGMTGPWQILGSARAPLQEMVRIDYLYVAGWTLWTDVKILLRTIPYVLSRRGM